jgi:hypothetical protein
MGVQYKWRTSTVGSIKGRHRNAIWIPPMPRPNAKSACLSRASAHPAWVTDGLIETTLKVWHDAPLTRKDAIDIILATSQLFNALAPVREPC